MVSTRGIKLKFSENERVLCYEPDPTKAKVLYDSKVLDVVITKDQRGKKSVEYLIHFQGWNSSWDRYVSEEYVLKDTAENRQLQKDLAEQSQLQLGAYLYRKDRKKHGRKTSERTAPSSDDGSSGSPARMDTDEGEPPHEPITSSSEEDSSADEDLVPVELPQDLKDMLEYDYEMINSKNKLLKLPAEPNVVNILENYWQHHFASLQNDNNDKTRNRHPSLTNQVKRKPEDIQKNLSICREVLDGIRVYFDFTLNDLLLYKPEQNQVQTAPAQYSAQSRLIRDDANNKHDLDYMDYTQNSSNEDGYSYEVKPITRRRALRSNKSVDFQSNGNNSAPPEIGNNAKTPVVANNNPEVASSSNKVNWRLLPAQVYNQNPPPPCLVYGAVHLTRLFVRLPELLNSSSIEESKLKTLLPHLDNLLEFLKDHKDWYGEKFYIDK